MALLRHETCHGRRTSGYFTLVHPSRQPHTKHPVQGPFRTRMTTVWSLNVEDPSMAKALFGHVGMSPDYRLVADNRRLQTRVRELEAELARVRAANEALMSHVTV